VSFDRRAAEALALELTMLAKVHGLNVEQIEITAPTGSARARRPRVRGNSERSDMPGNTGRHGRGDT